MFNQDLSGWNVEKGELMGRMFDGAISFVHETIEDWVNKPNRWEEAKYGHISGWDT